MRIMVLIVAGLAGLLGTARPAQAQFYRWGYRPYYRPYYAYGYPFYQPPVIYAVPPPFYYPPPLAYPPPYERYERPSSFRRLRPLRRPVRRVSVPASPPMVQPPAPSHNMYPPERSTN